MFGFVVQWKPHWILFAAYLQKYSLWLLMYHNLLLGLPETVLKRKISQAEWEAKNCSGVGKPCTQDKECCTENCWKELQGSAGTCDF